MFNRIVIGTANWAKEYNGKKLDKAEIKDILDYCTCCGITMLDTAEEYGSETVIGELANSSFQIVTKGNGGVDKSLERLQRDRIYGYLWRSSKIFGKSNRVSAAEKVGMSLYDPPEVGTVWGMRPTIIQVPYSLMDRRFESVIKYWQCTGIEIHVRSVFLRGKCLEKTSPQECLKFVLANRYIDRVVIGTDSLKQLKDNTDFIHQWNSLKCDDINIIDPRKWEKEKK